MKSVSQTGTKKPTNLYSHSTLCYVTTHTKDTESPEGASCRLCSAVHSSRWRQEVMPMKQPQGRKGSQTGSDTGMQTSC